MYTFRWLLYEMHAFQIHIVYIYGTATVSRIDKILGLFCKRTLLKRQYSAKETYDFIEFTNRSHPITSTRITHRNQILQRRFKLFSDGITRMISWWDVCISNTYMGWLRLVGSLKLQFSLQKSPIKRDYILQKRLMILRSLLIVATPWYTH